MKYEQTIQSLAELVAEQWETIQQKRNYIEYLENELTAKKNLNTSLESENQTLCNDNTKFSELIDKLQAETERLECELLTQRGLQGEIQKKLFEEQELRRCENELRGWGSLKLADVIKKTNDLKNMISAYNDFKNYDDEKVLFVSLEFNGVDHPCEIQLTNFESANITREFDEKYDEAYACFLSDVKVFTLKEKKANS